MKPLGALGSLMRAVVTLDAGTYELEAWFQIFALLESTIGLSITIWVLDELLSHHVMPDS